MRDARFSLGPNNTTVSLKDAQFPPVPSNTAVSLNGFTLISTEAESQRIVRTYILGLPQITVDLEGDLAATGRMSLLTIEAVSRVFLFDVIVCPAILRDAVLRDVLQGSDTVKVMRDS